MATDTAESVRVSLEALVAAKAKSMHRQIPSMARRVRELDATIESCEGVRHRIREKRDAIAERDDLAVRLVELESGRPQDAVRARAAVLCPAEDADERTVQVAKASIAVDIEGSAATPHMPEVDDTCDVCGPDHHMRRLAVESLMSCENCGNSEPYVDFNWNPHGHDKVPDFTAFSYKRSNHFIEWLNSAQGREQTTIPEEVLGACVDEIRKQAIPPSKVTPPVVRQVLKVIGKRKYYENSVLIWSKLTGKQPPRFTATQEEALKTMFLSIQEPFELVRREKVPERRNFLSYAYCLFKFCELLGLDSFLSSFTLLKGRDKLYRQDFIFEHICKELDWQFLPSV
jgi:hypothetical protein